MSNKILLERKPWFSRSIITLLISVAVAFSTTFALKAEIIGKWGEFVVLIALVLGFITFLTGGVGLMLRGTNPKRVELLDDGATLRVYKGSKVFECPTSSALIGPLTRVTFFVTLATNSFLCMPKKTDSPIDRTKQKTIKKTSHVIGLSSGFLRGGQRSVAAATKSLVDGGIERLDEMWRPYNPDNVQRGAGSTFRPTAAPEKPTAGE